MKSKLFKATLTTLVLMLIQVVSAKDKDNFIFVALGDTAYNGEKDYASYDKLISLINSKKPAFSIHVGDTWGGQSCDDNEQKIVLGFFNKYQHPLIYTPGDNEWTDCIDPKVDLSKLTRDTFSWEDFAVYQQDRLHTIRRLFFSKPQSLGASPIPLIRQGDISTYTDYVENSRWDHNGVLFVTMHVVGSNNGLNIGSKTKSEEATQRDRANMAWIKDSLAKALQNDYKAVVFSLHAALFENAAANDMAAKIVGNNLNGGIMGPYSNTVFSLIDFANKFKKPMLVIHGDNHRFVVDRPFLVYQGEEHGPKNSNITRLQVFGAPEIRAVKISVEPNTPWVFGFSPLY